jgi:hypothetical protein
MNGHYVNFYPIPLDQFLCLLLQVLEIASTELMLSLFLQRNSRVLHDSEPQLHQLDQVSLLAQMHDGHYQHLPGSSRTLVKKNIMIRQPDTSAELTINVVFFNDFAWIISGLSGLDDVTTFVNVNPAFMHNDKTFNKEQNFNWIYYSFNSE